MKHNFIVDGGKTSTASQVTHKQIAKLLETVIDVHQTGNVENLIKLMNFHAAKQKGLLFGG